MDSQQSPVHEKVSVFANIPGLSGKYPGTSYEK